MCQSGVSNSTSGDFGLDLSTVAKNEHLLLKSGFSSCNLFSVCFSQTD